MKGSNANLVSGAVFRLRSSQVSRTQILMLHTMGKSDQYLAEP